MRAYYERTALLRDRLRETGYDEWADELVSAERSAFTSGEALSNVTFALNRFRKEPMPDVLRYEIEVLIEEGERIWYGKALSGDGDE